jgi:DNA-binding beta-propeller fold protein YncE
LHAVSIDGNDTIYVSDARENGRVEKFDTNGNFISMWGSVGEKDGEFTEHHGIGFDSRNNVYVVDTSNVRVQIFSPDGKFLGKWGTMGTNPDQFIMPQDIAVGPEDNIYIVDVGDAHSELSYIGKFLEKNRNLTQTSCGDSEIAGEESNG